MSMAAVADRPQEASFAAMSLAFPRFGTVVDMAASSGVAQGPAAVEPLLSERSVQGEISPGGEGKLARNMANAFKNPRGFLRKFGRFGPRGSLASGVDGQIQCIPAPSSTEGPQSVITSLFPCSYSFPSLPMSTQALALSTSGRLPKGSEDGLPDVIFLPVRTGLPGGGGAHPCSRSPMVAMAAPLDGSRRSRIRGILDRIIRQRNKVVPSDAQSTEGTLHRFDASTLNEAHSHLPGEVDDLGGAGMAGDGKTKKRVLILMSDTGGGHRASAEALKTTFELEYGGKYEIAIVDAWKEHTPFPFNQMPKSYSFLVKHESLWRMAFYATKPRFVHQPQMAATSAFVAREVAKMLDIHRPDIIVSVHPLMQHIPLRVLRSRGLLRRIPFTTVITDLTTCHPTWFHKLVTTCFCPTKEVAQRALKAGLTPPQLRVYGLPVRPAFSRPPSMPKVDLRRELGMHTELPAAILIGGGEGMGPVEATARALAKVLGPGTPGSGTTEAGASGAQGADGPKGQLVIICGRNKKLRAKLEAIDWPMPTLIKGFVSNMPDLMAACDCIVTKAGPGTIAESLIRGLPLILNDFIAGQEVGNVPYVVDNGAGLFCDKPTKIAQIISDWFGPKAQEFAAMSANARRLARPEAVFRIVRDLDTLACGEKLMDQRELALLS